MKFAVFALIAGLCLIASTHAGTFVQSDDFEAELLSQEFDDGDLIDFEDFGIWTGIKGAIKGALRTLKAINCTVKFVDVMKQGAIRYIAATKSCGGDVSKQVQALINQCNAIIATCNNIGNTNDQVCNNGNYNEETDSGTKSSAACFKQMLKQLRTLKNQIKKALSMIQKLPKVSTDAGVCTAKAATDLGDVFIQFPTYIKSCSKLTSY